jgi:hypothetical protein
LRRPIIVLHLPHLDIQLFSAAIHNDHDKYNYNYNRDNNDYNNKSEP